MLADQVYRGYQQIVSRTNVAKAESPALDSRGQSSEISRVPSYVPTRGTSSYPRLLDCEQIASAKTKLGAVEVTFPGLTYLVGMKRGS